MLELAVLVLGLAVLLGSAAAFAGMTWPTEKPPLVLAALHGVAALAGFALLFFALQGPPRGAASGTQSFGTVAAILLAAAIVLGLWAASRHFMRRRFPGFTVAAHASAAVMGFVLLAVYWLLG